MSRPPDNPDCPSTPPPTDDFQRMVAAAENEQLMARMALKDRFVRNSPRATRAAIIMLEVATRILDAAHKDEPT